MNWSDHRRRVTDVDDGAGGPSHGVARRNSVPEEENRGEVMVLEENLDEALSQGGRRVGLVEQEERMMTKRGPGLGAFVGETERVVRVSSRVPSLSSSCWIRWLTVALCRFSCFSYTTFARARSNHLVDLFHIIGQALMDFGRSGHDLALHCHHAFCFR